MLKRKSAHISAIIAASVLATALVIYLTPLKHLNLVPAHSHDIDPAQFWSDYQGHPDRYLLIDVRTPTQYAAAHAQGAVNMPAASLYDTHGQLPRSGKQIALICGDGRLAAISYGYLEDLGFLNLLRIRGGLQQWVLEDLPVAGAAASSTATFPPQ